MKNLIVFLFLFSSPVFAHTLHECTVLKKWDVSHGEYSQENLDKYKYSIKIYDFEEEGKLNGSYFKRCSFESSANKVTCDKYLINYTDHTTFPSIKKYYYFKGHYDVQLFTEQMIFIENNGRGSFAFGNCVTR